MKASSKKKESKSKHLGLIVEKMMDKNCPSDLQVSEGIGADNMTCIIVELNRRLQGTSAWYLKPKGKDSHIL